jgi:uncharacterized protein (TIGR00369 family)
MTGRAADKIEGALRTRTFSWVDPRAIDAEGRQKSGLEFLRAGIDAKTPKAPIAATLDFVMTEAEAGRVLMTAEPQEFHYNPIGVVHGALAAALLDSAMSCAVHTTLPAGVGYTTLDLNLTFVRGLTVESGPVCCEGKVVHRGRRVSTAEGRLWIEESGKLAAHGKTTCLIRSEAVRSTNDN